MQTKKILMKPGEQLLSVVLISFFFLAPSSSFADGESVNGQEIFEEYCAVCHGYDGIPMLPEAPSFAEGERMGKSDEDLMKSIMKGLGEIMPPWEEEISEKQSKAALAYIRKGVSKGKVKKDDGK